MSYGRAILMSLSAFTLIAAMLATARAADLKDPDQVKICLRLMMQVTNDFDRQITRKTYGRLPHENMEFQEATGALRKAIANEPEDFKTMVDRTIQKAIDAAQKEADDSASKNETVLRKDQGILLEAVNAVFAHFPEESRPDPNVQPGRRPPA